jgi:transcriptional regulator with XRE-family HTH domain
MAKKEMYGGRIKTFRTMRGFTQEDVASKIGVDQNKYSRIETDKQKVDDELLEKIADTLGVSSADIKSKEPFFVNHASNQGTQIGIGQLENFYSDQKEIYEKLINTQSTQIEKQGQVIDSLTLQIAQLLKMLEKI